MKFNMKKAAALLLAGSMVAGYAVPAAAEAEEKVVTAAMDQAWDTMMPLNTTSNYTRFICDQIYDRLTQTNADGSIEGRLAESWTVNDAVITWSTLPVWMIPEQSFPRILLK